MLIVLVPAALAYLGPWPDIAIVSSKSTSANEPFASPFTISNSGWIPATEMALRCKVAVRFAGGCTVGGSIRLKQPLERLERGHPESFFCFRRLRSYFPAERGEVRVEVAYYSWIIPYKVRQAFRFKLIRNAAESRWVPRADTDGYESLSRPNVFLGDIVLDRLADEDTSKWSIMGFGPGFQCGDH